MLDLVRPRGSASPPVVAICHQPASSFHAAQPCTPHRVPERYARRRPKQTPLYRIVTRHLETWLAERSLGEHPVAVHVEEERRSYLRSRLLTRRTQAIRASGFFAARPITPGDLDTLTDRVRKRLIRWFRRAGLLDAATAADPKNTRARRRFGKGFRVALRPLGTPKESPTRGPRCSEANQHPSHACGCAIDRPILWAMVLLWTASFETILLYAGEGLGIFSLLTVAAVSLASIAAGVPCYYLTVAMKRV